MSTRDGAWAVETPPERPADPVVRQANLRRVLGLFRPYGMRLGAVLSLIVLSAGLDIISPFLLKAILDTAIPERDNALLTALVGGLIAIVDADALQDESATQWLAGAVATKAGDRLASPPLVTLDRGRGPAPG